MNKNENITFQLGKVALMANWTLRSHKPLSVCGRFWLHWVVYASGDVVHSTKVFVKAVFLFICYMYVFIYLLCHLSVTWHVNLHE